MKKLNRDISNIKEFETAISELEKREEFNCTGNVACRMESCSIDNCNVLDDFECNILDNLKNIFE